MKFSLRLFFAGFLYAPIALGVPKTMLPAPLDINNEGSVTCVGFTRSGTIASGNEVKIEYAFHPGAHQIDGLATIKIFPWHSGDLREFSMEIQDVREIDPGQGYAIEAVLRSRIYVQYRWIPVSLQCRKFGN